MKNACDHKQDSSESDSFNKWNVSIIILSGSFQNCALCEFNQPTNQPTLSPGCIMYYRWPVLNKEDVDSLSSASGNQSYGKH